MTRRQIGRQIWWEGLYCRMSIHIRLIRLVLHYLDEFILKWEELVGCVTD